ncbi:MAG: FtsX-like permease family protein [Bacilli bacterium]|nr:FtsX-like permease family protein [Bacilli bacterium]
MYLIKQAWLSIIRNKGRNILMGVIIIVIAVAVTITLSIVNSSNKIVKSYEEKYEIQAYISMDRNNLMNSLREDNATQEEMINKFNEIESLIAEEITSYGDSKYIKDYYFSYNLGIDAKDIKEATDSLIKETTETKTEIKKFGGANSNERPSFPGGANPFESKKTTTTKREEIKNIKAEGGAFNLIGYSSVTSMTDFISGTFTIVDGEVFSDFSSSSCVISEELASLNELNVGDTITLVSPKNSKKTYDVKITGIYKENSLSVDDMNNMFTSSANTIITNSHTVGEILGLDSSLKATLNPTYILNDKEDMEAFTNEVKEKGLSEYYTVTNNLEDVSSATESIKNVKTFALTFLLITIIIGVVVLFVLNTINIRERRYEIGVLRTIGMKKSSVIFKFLVELLIVSFISLVVGAGIGSFTSVDVANKLLEQEIKSGENHTDAINENFGKNHEKMDFRNINGSVNVEKIDNIDAIVDFKVIFELLGIGLLITMISSMASCIAIARFSPLTILKERS